MEVKIIPVSTLGYHACLIIIAGERCEDRSSDLTKTRLPLRKAEHLGYL